MDIRLALPKKKFADAYAQSKTDEWKLKRSQAIGRIREWEKHRDRNKAAIPVVMMGYGKDSSALCILARDAGIDHKWLSIDNQGDLPAHYTAWPEFNNFIDASRVVFTTEKPLIDILDDWLYWGQINGMPKKNGVEVVDFFDLGKDLEEYIYWEASNRFLHDYIDGRNNVQVLYGMRGAEQMDRFYMMQKGLVHFDSVGDDLKAMFCYPIGDWRDIDVWALLVSEDAPVSPVYSFNELPWHGGKHKFPRTTFYTAASNFNSIYYKWLARYGPAQLKDLEQRFPEIRLRFAKPVTSRSAKPSVDNKRKLG